MFTLARPRFVAAFSVLVLAACPAALAGPPLGQEAGELPEIAKRDESLIEGKAALRAADFAAAIERFNEILGQPDAIQDEALYLKALAHFYADQFDAALTAADQLLSEHAKSPWFRKGRFLKARTLSELRRFDEAEVVYREEADRLLSQARKHEIAGVAIGFADALARRPDPKNVGAQPPDFLKAYGLYGKVLEMEIGRELRDDVLFKRARAVFRAENHQQAINDLRTYLAEFDPNWPGGVGTTERAVHRKRENDPVAGDYVLQARLILATAQLKAGQPVQARTNVEDLLKLVEPDNDAASEHAGIRADAAWLLVLTHGTRQPSADGLDKAIQASRRFLEVHKSDPRAVQAAWYIAETYRNHGRADSAIAAYQQFIDRDGFSLPEGAAATEKLDDVGKSPAELFDGWRQTALYRIGELRLAQRKYNEAVAAWFKYVQQFPNGPHWAECQRGIVNAEYQQAVDAVAEERYDEARKLFDAFLAAHPLDDRAAQILFALGQIDYVAAQELAKQQAADEEIHAAYGRAIDAWQRLVSKYPNTEPSSLALYRIGLIYEEQLHDLDEALASYRWLTWGSMAPAAAARVTAMTEKQLALTTERKFRTDETARVQLNVRNVEKLTVEQYYLDLESYFRKTHDISSIEALDVDLIQPDKTWEVEIDGYQKYAPLEQQIEIPLAEVGDDIGNGDIGNGAGVCIVRVSNDDLEATTLVIRSDLELIVKSSRRELLVFAQDRRRRKPVADVDLLISDGKNVFAEAKTGGDGVYRAKLDELKDLTTVCVFASSNGSVASHNLELADLQFSQGLSAKGYLYTDRPAYQPGQTVKFRGIIRDVKEGAYVAPAGDTYLASVIDAAERTLWEQPVVLNEFGAFHGEMPLDENASLGAYKLVARQPKGATYSSPFVVQRFQLEKLKLTLETDEQVYLRGDEVKLRISAEYYWGQPAAEKPLRVRMPDGRSLTGKTDAEGKWTVSQDTSGLRPGTALQFQASLEGENVSATHAAYLAVQGFQIHVEPSRSLVLSGEPIDVEIKTISPLGSEPVGREVALTVLRRAVQAADPVIEGVPWINAGSRPAHETTVLEQTVTTDEKTGIAHVTLDDEKLTDGGQYILRVSGQDRFKQVVSAQATVNVSDDDDATKLRLFADSDVLQVGRAANVRLHSRVEAPLALVTVEGETIISHQIISLNQGFNPIELDVDHAHFPNFRLAVALIDGRELRTAHKPFRVERQLNVTITPLAEAYEPGSTGKVELTVTDQLGHPVRGELSLALVDEALFAQFGDTTTPIRGFFEQDARRHAEFRVASTCGFSYAAATNQVSHEQLVELERVARSKSEQLALSQLGREFKRTREVLEFAKQAANEPAPAAGVTAAFADESAPKDVYFPNFSADAGIPSRSESRRQSWSAISGREEKEASAQQQPREELPAAGWWDAAIVTDDNGKTTVDVPMPETTTQWRLTARGVTVDTLVGQATANVLTRRDFFVTLKAPRNLREGDSTRVLASVHNLTDYAGPVKLTLHVLGGDDLTAQLARQTLEINVDKQSVSEGQFKSIDAPAIPRFKLLVDAAAGESTDAVARTVPIRPWGLEFADSAGGVAKESASAHVVLPDDREYQSRWLTVSVGPSLERSVIEMALGTNPGPRCIYPAPRDWGRTPASDLLAVVSALDYAKQVQAPQADVERLTRRARSLISSLVATQTSEGGWSWRGPKQDANWGVTATAFWALCEAKQQRLTVHAATFDNAKQFLQNALTAFDQTNDDAKAVVLHALSCDQAAEFAHVNRLHRERNRLSAPALAYSALAMVNLGRRDFAIELLDVLAQKAENEDVGCHWQGSAKQPWLRDDVETTAVAALALMSAKPESPQVEQAVEFLLARRGVWGFVPAKAHGPAIRALATYYRKGKYADNDYKIDVVVNGKPFETISSDNAESTVALSVPAELVNDGKNQIDFNVDGRGEFSYAASLRGFSRDLKDPESWRYPYVRRRVYRHAPLEFQGRAIGVDSTSPLQNVEIGQRIRVHVDLHESRQESAYIAVEEHLPAGMTLVADSLTGGFDHHVVDGDSIIMYFRDDRSVRDFQYELVAYATGKYRALPTVIRDVLRPERMRIGTPAELAVLAPGVKSDDPYQMNDAERFALGKLYFDDGQYQESAPYLSHLFEQNRQFNERDVARMLLWIHTTDDHYDARRVIDAFEVLRERFPALEIPFDKILTVGRAYRDIGEHERAAQVYRAAIAASFVNDSNISAILEDEGQFLASIDYQENLWREYPDTAQVVAAYFALSQALYQQAPNAHKLAEQQRKIAVDRGNEASVRTPERVEMLKETTRLLAEFLALYPTDPLADDAAFSMANALLDLKQYELVVEQCRRYRQRFAKCDFHSSFQYMIALGHFWQRQHEHALAAAESVANGMSDDRDLARYIIGQIYHAKNYPEAAIEWYRKVAEEYPDAQQAIDYFEEKHIAIDEVNVFRPGEAVELTIDYRNITEARCQVYRVDLMRLYLREKNLTNVTKVNLAGIQALVEKKFELGDGKDYVDKERQIKLDLDDEGAYLVICRGDNLFTSALVLVTPLTIEVQEDQVSGRVRANVIDAHDEQYVAEVHVKAIGSADKEFRSGETDLRGIFVADDLHGKATVIARAGESRYAFYRGEKWLGNTPPTPMTLQPAPGDNPFGGEAGGGYGGGGGMGGKLDYQQNLRSRNSAIQSGNYIKFDKFRRGQNKGVEVQKAQ